METLYKKFCKEKFDEKGELIDFEINCPSNFNFAYDVVDSLGKNYPDKIALRWCNVMGEKKDITFKEIMDLSNKAANFFISEGIKKGDKVMLMLKRHYEYWYVLLALHKIGAVAIPATHMLTYKDIVYRVESADVKAIVCTSENDVHNFILAAKDHCESLEKLYNVRKDLPGFIRLDKEIEKCSDNLKRIENSSEDPFLMYFTSGTTGYPKGVIHNYSYPLAHIITAVYWQNVQNNGLHLTVADTGWAKASWGKIYGQWLAGSAVMVYDFDKFIPKDLLGIIEKYKVTTFCAPPTIYRFLVKEELDKYDLSSLKYATSAGEAVNPEILKNFKEHTGLTIMEGFGQTESTLIIANLKGQKTKLGSIGRPTPLYDVKIVDDDGNESDYGEIVVVPRKDRKQYGIFCKYNKDDELYKEVWKNGVYHTKDIARRDEDGYFWYEGRKDDIIKSSGYRIGPFEVENVLMQHKSVLECAVTGVPDAIRGTVVKATVVLANKYLPTPELAKELQEFVKKNTAPYKYPRVVEFVSELPKTISGKTKRVDIKNNLHNPIVHV